jgi:putative endonuclease
MESVDAEKQRRVTMLAVEYLREKKLLDHDTRIDVILVSWPKGQREPAIEHFRHAFEAVGRWQMYS